MKLIRNPKLSSKTVLSFLTFTVIFLSANFSFANNLNIENITFGNRNPSSETIVIEFDISWENAWKTKINHDAAWLVVRLYDPSSSPIDKRLCQLQTSGTNPQGTSTGSNSNLEISIPSDKLGAFVRLSDYGKVANLASTNVQLTINYGSCGFDDASEAYVTVFGVEMVYVPEGAFYAGDFNTSANAFVQGSADSDPWYVSSVNAISTSNTPADGYYYASAGLTGEDPSGTAFTIPTSYPKGYGSFYAMKYEITEGQWVEFINSLPLNAARVNRDLTDATHKNTDSVKNRNAIVCSGSPLLCSTQRPSRALTYMSWMDLAAFLDWAALRPMTELEFEKMSRGPMIPLPGEFPWGTSVINPATTISTGDEDGTETITNAQANANYNATVLSGGDTSNGSEYLSGPLRSGIFADADSQKESAGASYYGILELSGNAAERVVTVGNGSGRNFTGVNGDGSLSTDSGFEGNANTATWPGLNAVVTRGVTSADGSGLRGGSWVDAASGARLRVSDRTNAANSDTGAYNYSGGRGVRTYDINN